MSITLKHVSNIIYVHHPLTLMLVKSKTSMDTMDNGTRCPHCGQRSNDGNCVSDIVRLRELQKDIEEIRRDTERIRAEGPANVERIREEGKAETERIRAESRRELEDIRRDTERIRGENQAEIEKIRGEVSLKLETLRRNVNFGGYMFLLWGTFSNLFSSTLSHVISGIIIERKIKQ